MQRQIYDIANHRLRTEYLWHNILFWFSFLCHHQELLQKKPQKRDNSSDIQTVIPAHDHRTVAAPIYGCGWLTNKIMHKHYLPNPNHCQVWDILLTQTKNTENRTAPLNFCSTFDTHSPVKYNEYEKLCACLSMMCILLVLYIIGLFHGSIYDTKCIHLHQYLSGQIPILSYDHN